MSVVARNPDADPAVARAHRASVNGMARVPCRVGRPPVSSVSPGLFDGLAGSEPSTNTQVTKPLTAAMPIPITIGESNTPPPAADMAYARAWAFNVGARHARGKILVFHDNDILCPAGYAAELVGLMARGSQAARLQRFVFYLTEPDTAKLLAGGGLTGCAPLHVRQNCEGHTLAVERDAYFALGGHDESFVGWGGEDNEMFNRCRSICCYPYGYLPFVHLHHTPQPRPADPS
jgi:hypothetical protein